ncbi:rho GTPase-activating protein 7-like [Chenopodium quinoa]|uniref:rho GTPase-activating protein 7-like n=1 Tax=Chenopodium quinoa TaxID=63459 RepID=UPI000B787F20|nr:rho GTPase-activating protein 7-like [Chenopodium quinoa]
MSFDEFGGVDSASMPSTSRIPEVLDFPRHPSAASSTLVELTTRLDFFKERRSQLMEQLHNLDLNYGVANSQDYLYRPSSPSWSSLSTCSQPGVYNLYILLLIAYTSPVIFLCSTQMISAFALSLI